MGLNAGSVIIPGKGTVFVGPPNAAPLNKSTLDPADPSTFLGWECLGHTSRDNAVSLSKEGGDATNLGSWIDPNLVSNRDAVSWGFTVNSLQVDGTTLLLAFPNGRITTSGLFVVPSDGGAIERAIYILCIDGIKRMGIMSPRSSISLGEAPSISTDSFFEIQLSGSMLSATEASGTEILVGDLLAFDAPVPVVAPSPLVSSATPPSAVATTPMTINGSYFTGATGVKFGATSATSVVVVNPNKITCIMPAGAAGSAAVTVVTPSGTSNALPYTRGA